ncbi:MAG: RdgB/HAM1 family non-canonical purine NTP pyrophosphatase [Microthrixaceae bacterium]
MKIVLASANPAKAAELREVLDDVLGDVLGDKALELVPRPAELPEVVEDKPDFLGNARLKAEAIRDATGETALADDSGLEVDGLDGRPGVVSARFAGEGATDTDNVALLLSLLGGATVGDPRRRARFRCTIVLAMADGTELVAEGAVEGQIVTAARGESGFGYDPVFVPEEGDGRTFAEMSSSEKHEISHRGRALRALAEQLGD